MKVFIKEGSEVKVTRGTHKGSTFKITFIIQQFTKCNDWNSTVRPYREYCYGFINGEKIKVGISSLKLV